MLIHHPQIAVTGDDVVADYLERLNSTHFSSPALASVQALHRELADVGGDADANVRIYQRASGVLREIGLQAEAANAVQVDLHHKAERVELPQGGRRWTARRPVS